MAIPPLKIPITAIDKTARGFASARAGLKRLSGSILNVRTALAGLAAGVGIQQLAVQIDDLAKASSRLGLTVNELQSLQFAASQSGASAQELEKGLTRFSRAISEASTGIGTGLRSFEALGITVTNAQGELRPTAELLNEVSDRLSQIESPADRVRIAFDLFGRSGVNLINTLQNGSGEINKLRKQFNDVTLELTGANAKAVEAANDRFDMLRRVLGSIGARITSVVLPVLADVATFLVSTLLSAVSASITGIRNLLNTIVDLGKELGILEENFEAFTFGAEVTKDLDRIVSNLDSSLKKNQQQIERMDTPYATFTDHLGDTAKGFERVNDKTSKAVATFTAFGDRIGFVTPKVDTSRTALEEYQDAILDTQKAMQDASLRGIKSLEDNLLGLIQGTVSAKEAFRSMAASIVADLGRIFIQRQITAPLAASMGSFFTGKAVGGSVQRGKPYMVGERGAEMFVPNQSGSIIPNNRMGGGTPVVVNQTINLSTGVAQTVRMEVMNMLPDIEEATKGAVLDAKRRGGSFARYV